MQKIRGDEEGSYSSSNQNQQPQQVMDGADITGLVENKEMFSKFVDDKFEQLDRDRDGKLSVQELQPALAGIGAVLDLPAQGASPKSDAIYSQVLNEFTHGKEDKVRKPEFKEVLSDILLGVADGLKRDPIEMRKMDGQALSNFLNSSSYGTEIVGLYAKLDGTEGSLRDCIAKGLEHLTVDEGMPPPSDPWIKSNVVEPALQHGIMHDMEGTISQETFEGEFRNVGKRIANELKLQPVTVAHTEKIFDGNGIKGLLSNRLELDKWLNSATAELPKDRHHNLSKEYLLVALDIIAPAAGLPPYGAVSQIDELVNEGLKLVKADEQKLVDQNEFKKLLLEILGTLMLQLQEKPLSVISNSVVHEPPGISSASFLTPTSS